MTEHQDGDLALNNVAVNIDHVNELQYLTQMLLDFMNGTLYSGTTLPKSMGRLTSAAYNKYWPENTNNLPKGTIVKPNPFTKKEFGNLNLLFGEAMGSLTTRDSFMGLEAGTNRIKDALFAKVAIMSDANFRTVLSQAILSGRGEEQFLTPTRRVSRSSTTCLCPRWPRRCGPCTTVSRN